MARALAVTLLAGIACGSDAPPPPPVARAWEIMGTVVTVGAWSGGRKGEGGAGADTGRLTRALDQAYDSLRLVDSLLSTYRDSSEISRINRGRGTRDAERVSETFAVVLREALAVARASHGAFDPTLKDWRGVVFDSARGAVRLGRGLALDFGGIAKGYALDRATLALRGIADSAVWSIGGQLLFLGMRGGREVGIPDPDNSLQLAALVRVPAGTVSVSTSSQAERPGHLVDPRTGRAAARCGVRSVTAIAPTGMAADAWSTAFFVMGCDSALALVRARRLPGIDLVCIDRTVRWSAGLEGAVALPTDSAARGPAPGRPPAPAPARAP
ncbi:MAG: FAD:protein FMN transferase [Gemmatimonadales bacterium]